MIVHMVFIALKSVVIVCILLYQLCQSMLCARFYSSIKANARVNSCFKGEKILKSQPYLCQTFVLASEQYKCCIMTLLAQNKPSNSDLLYNINVSRSFELDISCTLFEINCLHSLLQIQTQWFSMCLYTFTNR